MKIFTTLFSIAFVSLLTTSYAQNPALTEIELCVSAKTEDGLAVSNVDWSFGVTTEGGDTCVQVDTDNVMTFYPEKALNPLNGVTTEDLLVMRQHILAIESFSSTAQHIASDVNKNGSTTTLDIVLTMKLLLGDIESFAHGESWKFYLADESNPSVVSDPVVTLEPEGDQSYEFVATKFGDVNNTVDVTDATDGADPDYVGSIPLYISNVAFEAGQVIEVPIGVGDFSAIQAFQLSLRHDTEVLEFLEIEGMGLTEEVNTVKYGLNEIESGLFKSIWVNNLSVIPNETSLYALRFMTLQAGQIEDVLEIDYTGLQPEAYTDAIDAYTFNVNYTPVIPTSNEEIATAKIISLAPNPFVEEAQLTFSLPQAERVQLRVFDSLGRTVLSSKADYTSGSHTWSIAAKDLPSSGVYFVELEGMKTKQRLTQRLVKR